MDNQNLTAIFRNTHRKYFKSTLMRISAVFYPYRSLRHTIERTPFYIRIRVSRHFISAPLPVLENLALILLAKAYRLKVDPSLKRVYMRYTHYLRQQLPPVKKRSLVHYQPQGRFYNLAPIFTDINRRFFNERLHISHLGWSRYNSYRRLGFYDHKRQLLVISRIFDQPKVPLEVVAYLLYHEMLHISIPIDENKVRRSVHSAAFRKLERAYPDFKRITAWIKHNLHKL